MCASGPLAAKSIIIVIHHQPLSTRESEGTTKGHDISPNSAPWKGCKYGCITNLWTIALWSL